MRTLLTYVLAALAVTIVPVAFDMFWLADEASGDPRVIAGAVSELIVSAGLAFLGALIFVGALWRVVGYASNAFRLDLRGWMNLPRGIAAHLILVLLFLLPELVLGAAAADRLAPGFDGLTALVTALVAGSIWGTVFWMRAPREPQEAGIAA